MISLKYLLRVVRIPESAIGRSVGHSVIDLHGWLRLWVLVRLLSDCIQLPRLLLPHHAHAPQTVFVHGVLLDGLVVQLPLLHSPLNARKSPNSGDQILYGLDLDPAVCRPLWEERNEILLDILWNRESGESWRDRGIQETGGRWVNEFLLLWYNWVYNTLLRWKLLLKAFNLTLIFFSYLVILNIFYFFNKILLYKLSPCEHSLLSKRGLVFFESSLTRSIYHVSKLGCLLKLHVC